MLKRISPKALTELLTSEDAGEQQALRCTFAYLGQDTSWSHAEQLRSGSAICDWMIELLESKPEERFDR